MFLLSCIRVNVGHVQLLGECLALCNCRTTPPHFGHSSKKWRHKVFPLQNTGSISICCSGLYHLCQTNLEFWIQVDASRKNSSIPMFYASSGTKFIYKWMNSWLKYLYEKVPVAIGVLVEAVASFAFNIALQSLGSKSYNFLSLPLALVSIVYAG